MIAQGFRLRGIDLYFKTLPLRPLIAKGVQVYNVHNVHNIHIDIKMDKSTKTDIATQIQYILQKLSEQHEIEKEKGFPSRKYDYYTRYHAEADAKIPEKRWRSWANELGIDFARMNDILGILVNKGLIKKFEYMSELR